MTDSVIGFNQEGYDEHRKIVREVTRRMRNETPPRGRYRNPRTAAVAVILDDALAAASHALTGASSGLATVCKWSAVTETYEETEIQITVWNHAEHTSHAVDTFGVAKDVDGHWHFFGDCGAMAAR